MHGMHSNCRYDKLTSLKLKLSRVTIINTYYAVHYHIGTVEVSFYVISEL